MTPEDPTIHQLLDRALSDDATLPEAVAALNAAQRLGLRVWGAPDGYCQRDGRLMPEASCLPPLRRLVLSWRNPNEPLAEAEVEEPQPAEVEQAPAEKKRGHATHIGRNANRSESRELICAMIARPEGASTDELLEATGMSLLGLRVAISSMRSMGRTAAVFDRDKRRYVEPSEAS